MNFLSSIKDFLLNSFLRQDTPEDDMQTISYTRANKRANDENANEEVTIKRKRYSPALPTRDTRSLRMINAMNNKQNSNYKKLDIEELVSKKKDEDLLLRIQAKKETLRSHKPLVCTDVIEINDDEAEYSQKQTSKEEIVGDIFKNSNSFGRRRSPRLCKPLASTSTDMKFIGGMNGGDDVINVEHVDQFGSGSFSENARDIQGLNIEMKPLKEYNNRTPMINGYPLRLNKRPTSLSSTSSSMSTSNSYSSFSNNLSLNKVRQEQDTNAFLDLMISKFKNARTSPKEVAPKLKMPVRYSEYSDCRLSVRLPILDTSALIASSSRFPKESRRNNIQDSIDLTTSYRCPTICNKSIIDLTDEADDEQQRQEIENNVRTSDMIRNLKSNFVGKNREVMDEDLISNLLKKYERKIEAQQKCASKIRSNLREKQEEFNKTLSDIFDSRLKLKEHEKEELPEQKPSIELAPITRKMTAAIDEIVRSGRVPLVQIRDTAIKKEDINTLKGPQWLNDEVINAYMNLIKIRAEAKPDKYPKVHCFNTFLFAQLAKKGYTSVRRWTKKIDIFDFPMLIVPIHLGNHWCLTMIDFKKKQINYYDSMGSPNNRCLQIMLNYLEEEYKDKKNSTFDTTDWELINQPSSEIPQQLNCNDCGVFACTFAEHITRQSSFNFSQEHMPYFRLKMMYEILTGELLL